jgi:neutral ceramidase
MYLMRIDDMDGNPIGEINWFGVHTTSLGNNINKVCSDNKGFASAFFEEEVGNGFNAVFAQQFAGDISPNFHGKGKKWKKGPTKNDLDNATFNGRLQYYKAKEIWEDALKTTPLEGGIESELIYVDFSNVKVDPDFADGRTDAETDSACHGVAFFSGTPVDGPGMPQGVKQFAIFCSWVIKYGEKFLALFRNKEYKDWIHKKYKVQGRKNIIFETGRGVAFGTRRIKDFFIPGFFDGGIKEMKSQHRRGALRELPWTPHVLPLQIIRLGSLALVGFPGEITTVGGLRLKKMMEKELAPAGIRQVIVSTYANNYMGYCVTHEEYNVQCYEGGHTVFGQWTHGAFMTKYRDMAREFVKKKEERYFDRAAQAHVFSEKEMALRSYQLKS